MKNLIIIFLLFASSVTAQVEVIHFNAGWNSSNDVEWVHDLNDCEIKHIDIAENTEAQDKHEIVVVPTIIVFNGKEVERFQANIMMEIEATKKDVQGVIDEIIYSDF